MYKKHIKRFLDFILSLIAIIALSPVMMITALLVRCFLGSPILFIQERPGKNEKIFRLYKFRTMTDKKDSSGKLLPDKDRITKLGRILRYTSIDELPELINILKGDMSIIGPRPLLVKYLPLYNEEQRRRHEVRPGLSGLAQVNGRNAISWEERFRYDLEYVDNISFLVDLRIVLKTVVQVLEHKGITSKNSATMEEFVRTKS